MKGKQTALMPGNGDKVGYWLTPPDLMAKLQAEFDFDFDPCPYPRPAGFDGLKEEWGDANWVNPPFGEWNGSKPNTAAWVRKAIEERARGKMSVFVLPVSGWIELLLEAGAEVRFLGRVKWKNPDGRETERPRWASALFILRPNKTPPPSTTEGGELANRGGV